MSGFLGTGQSSKQKDFVDQISPFLLNENRKTNSIQIIDSKLVEAAHLDKKVQAKLGLKSKPQYIVARLEVNAIDPQACVRRIYSGVLKEFVAHQDRKELTFFLRFFDNAYWSEGSETVLNNVKLDEDPIHVRKRRSTLSQTFEVLKRTDSSFKKWIEDESKWDDSHFRNAMYYYNSALGSMSLENSLSMLWTTLESLIPYRNVESDLEAVQKYVSKMIALGSFARDIGAFSARLMVHSIVNNHCYSGIAVSKKRRIKDEASILWWYGWLANKSASGLRFKRLSKTSSLLGYTYAGLGRQIQEGKLSALRNRFEKSQISISYQLDRAYFHRNKIVHSGDIVNEYSNLWNHIEWYSGKVLAYFLYEVEFKKNYPNAESAYKALEADYEYLLSYLSLNADNDISTMPIRIQHIAVTPYFHAILPED